jgi:hypothetical protein
MATMGLGSPLPDARSPLPDARSLSTQLPLWYPLGSSNTRVCCNPAGAAPDSPVRWDMVAAWSGRTIHALAQWDAGSRPLSNIATARPFALPPDTGGLRGAQLAALCGHLATQTTSRDDCFLKHEPGKDILITGSATLDP